MVNSLGSLVIDIKSDTTQLIQGFNRAEAAVNKTTKQMTYAVKGLIGAFVGLNTLDIAKNFTTQLDLITSANNKLKLVTKTTEEYTNAQKRLFEVAQITSAGYSETVTLYSKLSDSMGKMGKSQSDIIRTVETVNKTIALSGSTASEASAAILQLGQAFGSGRLQGDELKSISENAQGLALAIAEGMGVAVGELKQLGSEGKITSEILATALEKVANSTDEKYGKMTKTIAQSMQIVQNSISQVIAQFDKMTGISNVIADNIQGISKALDAVNSDDLESMFNTFKVGTELIVASYVALKVLKGGYAAYNAVLEFTNTITKQNIEIENAKNKAYNDGITASYARKAADEAMAKAQENSVNISKRNIEIEKAKAQAYSDGTRAVMARKLANQAMNDAQSSGLVMLEKHAKELDNEASNLEKVAKKQLDYSYSLEAKAAKPADMKYAKQLEAEAIQLEKTAKKQLDYSYGLESVAKRFNIATIATSAFKMALSTIPFIAITTGIGLIVEKLLSASKESDLFRDSISKTREELEKLSKAQIEVRIIGEVEELKKAEEQLAKLKKDLEKVPSNISIGGNVGGIGTIDVEKTNKKLSEQRSIIQANIDTVQFQVDKNKELLGILNDIKGEKTTTVKINTLIPKTETILIDWLINGDEVINKKVSIEVQKQGLTDELKNILEPKQVIIDKYKKLNEDLAKTDKNTTEYQLKLQKQMNDEIDNLDKEAVEKRKKAQSDKEKAIKDSEDRIKNLTKEATELTISDVDKINAKYLEMYNVIKDTFSQEQMKAFNTSWQEAVEKANGTLDAQKAKQDLVNQALATATNEVDTINNKYMEMYEAIKDSPLFDDAKMAEFYKKWQDEIDKTKEKLDFNTTIELDIIGDDKSIQRIEKSFQDLNKATKKYEENRKDIAKGSADEAKNEEMFRKDQMNGYINMAGALGSMFQQGSKEAATFQAAQLSLALVEGTRAILTSGTGDPYTAIPRMAAMAIMVKSLLGNIGVALGMNSTSTSGDSFSMATSNTGVGSTLGDSKKASESISNALKTLEDFAEPQYEVLNKMNNHLETIANNISGVSSLLVQNSATALGTNYTGGFNTGYKNNLNLGSLVTATVGILTGGAEIILDKFTGGALSGVINSVLGGVFGKTSVSQELKDSGITFADALLKNAKNDFEGSVYQTISTTTKKKSWFGSSSKTSLKTVFSGLNDEIENQFSLVLGGLYDTVLLSGQALDISSQSLYNSLDNFVVSIGKVSLKDKTGTEIQEILTNIFSKIGDDLTKSVIPNLTGFQQVGEGLFDTLTRVATGIQEASFYSDRLGASITKYSDIVNKQGVVGFEALYQSIKKMEQGTEGIDYGKNKNFMGIIDVLSGTAEELYNSYLTLDDIRITLSSITFYTDSLSKSMIAGAGSVSALSSGISDYAENFLNESEQTTILIDKLETSFSRLNISVPDSMNGFEKLIKGLDLTTESGQKLYGSLISLSGSFAEIFKSSDSNKLEWARKSLTDIQLLEAQLTDILGNNQIVAGQSKWGTYYRNIAWIDATNEATLLKSVENARAKAELDGIVTDEEQTLTMQLWDLYEATKANNEATAESNKLKAEELAKTRASLNERLQDTIYANNDSMLTQLKRQRELSDYTDATSISLLKQIYSQEDYNTVVSKNTELATQRKTLEERLQDTQYSSDDSMTTLIKRQRELSDYTDATSISLLKQIYSQEDYNDKIAETKTILEKLLGTFTNLGDSVSDTIKTLAGANTDSMSATQQIKSFWEKRKEIDSLLALNGNLTESQQSRLSDLVGEVNDLATNIQGLDTSSSSITNELIGNLTSLESALNFKEQVLSVNIVGIASNVALIENIAGISATVPTLTNNTSNYVTNSDLSTDIKDILTTIKDNISNYPKRTMDLIDDVIRGNSRVKVQSN